MYRLQWISKVQRYNLANFNGTNPQPEACKCSLTLIKIFNWPYMFKLLEKNKRHLTKCIYFLPKKKITSEFHQKHHIIQHFFIGSLCNTAMKPSKGVYFQAKLHFKWWWRIKKTCPDKNVWILATCSGLWMSGYFNGVTYLLGKENQTE